jgi:hypothetical protein
MCVREGIPVLQKHNACIEYPLHTEKLPPGTAKEEGQWKQTVVEYQAAVIQNQAAVIQRR